MSIESNRAKFFTTQVKVIAALPGSNPAIMAKVGIARDSANRHLSYLKERQLIYICGWDRSPNGGSYYPVYSAGCLPDVKREKTVKVKKILSAEALQKQREAKIMAAQRSIEMRSFSRGADYRKDPIMAHLYGAME